MRNYGAKDLKRRTFGFSKKMEVSSLKMEDCNNKLKTINNKLFLK